MTLACPAAVALAIVAILLLIPGASAGRQGQTTPDAVAWLVVEHIFDGQSLAFIAAAVRKSISTVKRIGRRFRDHGDVAKAPRQGRPMLASHQVIPHAHARFA